MEPWHKTAEPRREVREGRSFDPDEFAIRLEQVVRNDSNAPKDYTDPKQFFARTVFTSALKENLGLVLRRLTGKTGETSPVMSLVTQFGGGKTHTLTCLFHLAKNPKESLKNDGVQKFLLTEGVGKLPEVRVAVLVGNAWDPSAGRETPWIDLARQLAGDEGVRLLGPAAAKSPPGTDTLESLYRLAGGHVLILFDETLNLIVRHKNIADDFLAFADNLARSMLGTTGCAAVFSLPRSEIEMGDFEHLWQDRLQKVIKRVGKSIIVNDEGEIAEIVRRRLFDEFDDKMVKKIQKAAQEYAEWCFERRSQLPPEWTSVEAGATDKNARESLARRFATCYPFHPATLSVFQRKWQTLPQYQQTRGTLALLAKWVSWAYRDGWEKARKESFISLGSAPLQDSGFRSALLAQLGENRLLTAIETDISSTHSHARALDADAKGPLAELHRRVASAILFESSGGMTGDKVAHLPELRFALGEPGMDTTSIDSAANTLESRAFYLRKVGRDGFRFGLKPKLQKVVGDRRASLDEPDVVKAMRKAIEMEFAKDDRLRFIFFPKDGTEVPDLPRLTGVVADPGTMFADSRKKMFATWTRERGAGNSRLYPASLIWVIKKEGLDLREKVELAMAWKRVQEEISRGILGSDFEAEERNEVAANVKAANDAVKDEVWAAYRYLLIYDPKEADGLHVIDLGAGHSSANESLASRVMTALRSEGRLSESVGAGYLERNWPAALKEGGTWPLAGIRKSFLDGSLTRLPDPEVALRGTIPRLVEKGEFGLASGQQPNGTYNRVWFKEMPSADEIVFDSGTFLLLRTKAESLVSPVAKASPTFVPAEPTKPDNSAPTQATLASSGVADNAIAEFAIRGLIVSESWNKLGIRLIPTLKKGTHLKISASVTVQTSLEEREAFEREVRRVLAELGLRDWTVEIQEKEKGAGPSPRP
jgi:hypothetical protein